MNHLLEAYMTGDVVPDTDNDILRLTKLVSMMSLQFGDALWMKTLKAPYVYDKYFLKSDIHTGTTNVDLTQHACILEQRQRRTMTEAGAQSDLLPDTSTSYDKTGPIRTRRPENKNSV